MSKRIVLILGCFLLVAALAMGQGLWSQKTTVTFNRPVELPGMILNAGTYVFRLADSPTSRHVVEIYDAKEMHLYGIVMAIPNARLTVTGNTVIRFEERTGNAPEALRAWFYPESNWGQEFVYPKAKAAEIAETAHVPVLAANVTPAETPAEIVQEPVVAITPEQKEVEIATVVETPPEAAPALVAEAPAPAPVELPKTASPLGLMGLVGLASLGLSKLFKG
jgi:hypothetical protein